MHVSLPVTACVHCVLTCKIPPDCFASLIQGVQLQVEPSYPMTSSLEATSYSSFATERIYVPEPYFTFRNDESLSVETKGSPKTYDHLIRRPVIYTRLSRFVVKNRHVT